MTTPKKGKRGEIRTEKHKVSLVEQLESEAQTAYDFKNRSEAIEKLKQANNMRNSNLGDLKDYKKKYGKDFQKGDTQQLSDSGPVVRALEEGGDIQNELKAIKDNQKKIDKWTAERDALRAKKHEAAKKQAAPIEELPKTDESPRTPGIPNKKPEV